MNDELFQELRETVYGKGSTVGLKTRMEHVEISLETLVKLEERRSAWFGKIVAAVVIYSLVQIVSLTLFLAYMGLKTQLL